MQLLDIVGIIKYPQFQVNPLPDKGGEEGSSVLDNAVSSIDTENPKVASMVMQSIAGQLNSKVG